jgi:hypothetical protein
LKPIDVAVSFFTKKGLIPENIARIHRLARERFAPGAYYNVTYSVGGGSLGAFVVDDPRVAWFQTPVEGE